MNKGQAKFVRENAAIISALFIFLSSFIVFGIGWFVTEVAIYGAGWMLFYVMGVLPTVVIVYGASSIIKKFLSIKD